MSSENYDLIFTAESKGYLYFHGGYNSIDKGVPDWGTNQEFEALLVGDRAGDIVITYEGGVSDTIPLIFGYTLWWKQWYDFAGAPFKGDQAQPKSAALLREVLHLYGGFEGDDTCVLRVKIRPLPVRAVSVRNNPLKMGAPVFEKAEAVLTDPKAEKFFERHTVDSSDPVPDKIQSGLAALYKLLYHTEEDFTNILHACAPPSFKTPQVVLRGNTAADILTNIFRDNCWDMCSKIDPDGALNASSPGAYSWGSYCGFGTWRPDFGNYYGKVYSRDTGRGTMTIIDTGYMEFAEKVLDYSNEKLMFFPREYPRLTFGGAKIPGHWTVIINEPLIYSTYLAGLGWPTKYTKERFGEEYQNLGNLETDGHGLTMLATYKYFLTTGRDSDYVRKNWEYIREAAEFIVWCMDHPELSFTDRDVLYGETEAAMSDYTLYCNIPCCYGMLFYGKMAASIGEDAYAAKWERYHQRMAAAIDLRFAGEGGGWDIAHCGFYHDPVMTMTADFYGYDLNRFPNPEWVRRSVNSFEADLSQYVKDTYVGPRGLGYDFSIITQNALLLDRTADYTAFLEKLAKACYAPKLPFPYLVPEGTTVLPERGVYRREGDLGNLAQQGEVLKTILMVCGAAQLPDGTVQITPRTPGRCALKCKGFRVVNSEKATVDMELEFTENSQKVSLRICGMKEGQKAVFRAGPFYSGQVTAEIDGSAVPVKAYQSGDAFWADAVFERSQCENAVAMTFEEIH